MEGPRRFFDQAEAELREGAVWAGELYLEHHRGTYTTQAAVKQGNRRGELALRDAELWSALVDGDAPTEDSTGPGKPSSSTSSTTSSPVRGSTGSTRTPGGPRRGGA